MRKLLFDRIHTSRMDIKWDFNSHNILVVQKWYFKFTKTIEADSWTESEKDNFIKMTHNLIAMYWNLIPGTYLTLKDNPKVKHSISIIIRSVTNDIDHNILSERAHWRVNVIKYVHNKNDTVWQNSRQVPITDIDSSGLRNLVNWPNRLIQLRHNAISGTPIIDAPTPMSQIGIVHELGHALGYDIDEYRTENRARFRNDDASVMAFGHTIRERHYDYLKRELARMRQIDIDDMKINFR